ncbi:MAG TPA: hypothetical protein VGL71_09990, partial [Urbifossiella sp.]
MIAIPRSHGRDLSAVVRKLGNSRAKSSPPVELVAGRNGLTIHAATEEVAVRHHTPGRRSEKRLMVPLEAFGVCAGRDEAPVTFRSGRQGRLEVEWKEQGTLKSRSYPMPVKTAKALSPPIPPARFTPGQSGLLEAFIAAGTAAAKEISTRYVLNRIQLRGGRGEMIASDSKQLLLQGGFTFPWSGDVLVPASEVFTALAALKLSDASIARTASHVWIAAGPWSVALAIDATGKFPDVGTLLARTKTSRSELILDSDDRARLLREVPTLPGRQDEQKPVTLDLAGPILRAKGEGDTNAVEIALSKSQVRGKRSCVACARTYLLAAMKLGFDRISIGSDNHPVVCRDATRTYLFMPLSGNEIVPAASRPGSKRMTKSPPVTHLPKSAPAPKPVSLP